MKKHFSETDIWTFLESKDFSQLSEAEKSSVLTFLSEEKYLQMRKLTLQAQQQMPLETTELQLAPDLGKRIFEKGQQKRRSLLKRLALYQVPAWQAAAVALFLALTFYAWGNSSNSLQHTMNTSVDAHDSLIGISLAEDTSLSRFMIESL